jgi:3-keto-5-aminohexanoate cleavage enzyme
MSQLIITCAIVGAEVTREQTPHLPLTPDEMARDAELCARAGAAVVHLHVRDSLGRPCQDPARFQEVERKIRERCDVIVQYSTGGAVGTPIAARLAPLDNRPEMATLTTGTVNFGDDVFENSMPVVRALASRMFELEVKPELEIFDYAMIDNAHALIRDGLLRPPYHFDFVLGVPGALQARPEHIAQMRSMLPQPCSWQVAAVGRHQLPMTTIAMAMGGHVRVGLEDNIYYRRGALARNHELVERAARIAGELGRDVATPAEARSLLSIRES